MSVDGLHRRSSSPNKAAGLSSASKRGKINTRTASSANTTAKTKTKTIHTSVNRHSETARNNFGSASERRIKEADDEQSIRDFFTEIQDMNPTDLTDVPENSSSRKDARKKSKQAKKSDAFKRVKPKKHRHIFRNTIIIILLVLAGLFAVAYFIANDFVGKVTDGGSLWDVVFSDPATPLKRDANGRTNVLIFGTEGYDMNDPNYDGGYLTDSMMLISFDQDTGVMQAVSLPRDLKTKTCTATGKINEVFWCQYQKSDKSPEQNKKYEALGGEDLANAFEEVIGLEVHYRVHLNWQALVQGIDALGGIDVVFLYGDQTWDGPETTIVTTSPKGLADGAPGHYHIQFPNRQAVHLDGEAALAVARTRNAFGGYGAAASNFSREIFQQRIAEAAMKKAKQMNFDLAKIFGLKDAIGDNLRTNFQDTEIKTLLKLSQTLDLSSLESISLAAPSDGSAPLMTTSTINGISYVIPAAGVGDYSAIHRYIDNKIHGSEIKEEASVAVMNAAGVSGLAAREKINLEDAGFTVSETTNAPEELRGFSGVRIYQISADKPQTAKKLESFYAEQEFELITEIPAELANSSSDFVVMLGAGSD